MSTTIAQRTIVLLFGMLKHIRVSIKGTMSAFHSDSIFSDICNQIVSFTIGDEVEVIPENLCKGMSKLQSINIPNSVKAIGNNAFQGCALLDFTSLKQYDECTKFL